MRLSSPIAAAAGLAAALLPTAGHAAEKGQLPQLDVHTFASQLFWLAVLFVIVYLFLQFVGAPRIVAILDERRARIGGDLDSAEKLRGQADETLKAYEAALADAHGKARALLGETHERNVAALNEQTRAATQKFDREVADAIRGIEATRDAALSGLQDTARTLAADVTQKIAGRAPSPDSVARAVAAASQAKVA